MIKLLTQNRQPVCLQWVIVFVIAALMTNLGYGSNLILALQCEQYYFEYLLFFVMVFGAKVMSDRFQSPADTPALFKVSLLSAGLISVSFFGILWTYNTLTHCPFDPIQFITTRVPLIFLLSGIYQYWKLNQSRQKSPEPFLSLCTIQGETLRFQKEEIASARLKNGILRVKSMDGKVYLTDCTLKGLYTMLDNQESFYRLNRSNMAHRSQIKSFTTNQKRQLLVRLHDGEEVLVNKNAASAFKNWLG